MDPNVILKVYEGHFATVHSHITKYIDFATIKSRRSEAMAAANILGDKYVNTTIDTAFNLVYIYIGERFYEESINFNYYVISIISYDGIC